MKKLKSYPNRIIAGLLTGMLENADIPYFIQADDCGGTFPMIAPAVKVMVSDNDLERATEILRSAFGQEPDVE